MFKNGNSNNNPIQWGRASKMDFNPSTVLEFIFVSLFYPKKTNTIIKKLNTLILLLKKNNSTSIGITVPKLSAINFKDISSVSKLNSIDMGGFRCFKKHTVYNKSREEAIFSNIENGAAVVNSTTYDYLKLMRQSFQN